MTPISTKDRLPEDRQHVLFYRYAWMLGMFYDEDKFFCERGGICHSQCMISHWMLLPGDPSRTGCALEQATLICSDCLEQADYIQVIEGLLETRNSVLEAIPECPVHGNQCVPHALEWIENAKKFVGD